MRDFNITYIPDMTERFPEGMRECGGREEYYAEVDAEWEAEMKAYEEKKAAARKPISDVAKKYVQDVAEIEKKSNIYERRDAYFERRKRYLNELAELYELSVVEGQFAKDKLFMVSTELVKYGRIENYGFETDDAEQLLNLMADLSANSEWVHVNMRGNVFRSVQTNDEGYFAITYLKDWLS